MLVAELRTTAAGPVRRRRRGAVAAAVAGVALAVAVGWQGPWDRAGPTARILHPADGAVVGSPVPVLLDADGVELTPCGVPAPCEGHLTVLVDRPCLAPGELVPSASLRADDLGVHALTDGSRVLLLDLPTGEHTLCAQLADGVRIAFGATDTVTVTVDHVVTRPSLGVMATVPPEAGRPGDPPTRSERWPAPTSVAASRTSP